MSLLQHYHIQCTWERRLFTYGMNIAEHDQEGRMITLEFWQKDAYTWWSYLADARARNIGWRIDYFLVSDRLQEFVKDSTIYPKIMGSDHCPIGLEIF